MQRRINFKRAEIQNFFSIGEEPVIVDFFRGLHFITGINKDKEDRQNGTGKSTIVDGIYFAITGSTIREIKKENIQNNVTKGTTKVKLTFEVVEGDKSSECVITRTLGPSKCTLYIDGVDKTRDSIANTTAEIFKILSCTQNSLQNFLSMTASNTVPFFAKSKTEKREFNESLLNMSVIADMRDAIKEITSANNKLRATTSSRLETLVQQKKDYEHQIYTQQLNNERKKKQLEDSIALNESEIARLVKVVTERSVTESLIETDTSAEEAIIEQSEQTLSEKQATQLKIQKAIATLDGNISVENRNLQKLKSGDKSIPCPTCKRPFDQHDAELIKNEILAKEAEISSIVDKKRKLEAGDANNNLVIAGIKQTIQKSRQLIKAVEDRKRALQEQLRVNENTVRILNEKRLTVDFQKKELTELDANISISQQFIDDMVKKIEDAKVEQAKAQKEYDILAHAKFVLDDTGIKAFLIKKIINVINNEVSRYMNALGSTATCVFNEYFDEKITGENGQECSYWNFSGAERKTLDLAVMFAFISVIRMQGEAQYNLLLFDELIDGTFDPKGVEQVLTLIKQEGEQHNLATYIISHRKELFGVGDSVIVVQKENFITTRVA